MQDSVHEALQAGATLVTANQRLARHLAAEYGAAQRALGAVVWETPDILPWTQWLERFWQDSFGLLASDNPQPLLSNFQELTLWENVIREAEREPLLQIPAAARAARDAWQLLHAYRIPLSQAGESGNEDATAFAGWARAYRRRCDAAHYLDSARLVDAVREAVSSGRVRFPGQLITAGFDEFTPQQQALLDALRAAGCRLEVLAEPACEARAARVACADARAELAMAAAWARAGLDAGVPRIGIVVPDLAAQRVAVLRAFDEALIPEALVGGADVVRPYNVSLGESLAELPMIHAALRSLEAGQGRVPLALASAMLRSPFLAGHAEEMAARAQLDARLRQAGEETINAHGLMREARAALAKAHTAAPRLADQLRVWRDALPSPAQRLAPSGWSEIFGRLLHLVGWPGDGAPDHDRVRALEAWRDLLSDLSAQDPISRRLSYMEAFSLLRRMAMERVFQPPSPAAPVQVLGLMEASGLAFDRLWVLGLDDETWPASPRPNPFLPLPLQRAHGMPHASAERELEFAQRLTGRLARSAAQVVFSHPRHAGDEERRPSPLLASLPELRAADLPPLAQTVAARQYAAREMESLSDMQAPELPAGSQVGGGTTLLQLQAACPFRAFAQVRLGARSPEEPEPGLDARARGQLVHAAFKLLWEALGSHAQLCSLADDALREIIERAVTQAIDGVAPQRGHTLSGRFREVETRRLVALLRQWLEVEKARAPFRVLGAELPQALMLGGLQLSGRMDRIDALDGGGVAIMDYKTGHAEPKDWQGERPDEPQLPAYAIGMLRDEPVRALLFARLRLGDKFGFAGLAESAGVAPRVPAAGDEASAWSQQIDTWRATLDGLASAFRAGDARVDPKEFPKTCEYCGLQALCRVHEQGIVPRESEEAEAGDD